MVCDGSSSKGKESFMFAGEGWGDSEVQKITPADLSFPNIFRTKRGFAYLGSVLLNRG